MFLSHPIWLMALLPWAAVTLYLLWGRRKRINVPFLDLWQIPVRGERPRRKLSAPPVALAMAILAMLLGILAAAGPRVAAARGVGGAAPVTVIVDRGISMSARGREGARYAEGIDEVSRALGAPVRVDLFVIPGEATATATDASDLLGSGQRIARTAVRSEDAVRRLVRGRLEETSRPVVVVSDADLGPLRDHPRVVQVAPEAPVRNAGIVAFAARESPRPQVMVRVRNDSPGLTSATLSVTAAEGAAPAERVVDLPAAGAERDYFFDVAAVGETVSARLVAEGDELPADDRAWLVRESAWPVIEAKQPVGALERLVGLYRQLRPASANSRRVYLVADAADLAAGTAGVVVHAGGSAAPVRPAAVVPHPITGAVRNWTGLDLPLATTAAPPAGWTPLLSTADGRVLVAVSESNGARRAWVAVDASRWADTHEYVAFWTATLDWVGTGGRGGDDFASHPLGERDPDWQPSPGGEAGAPAAHPYDPALWPGVFTRRDGALRAFHAPPAGANASPPSFDWRAKLDAQAQAAARLDLAPALLLASAAALVVAAATWRRRPRRDPAAGPGDAAGSAPVNFAAPPRRRRRRRLRRGDPGASPISAES